MKRIISLRRSESGTTYLIATILPGTPDDRFVEKILTPFKAKTLQQAIDRFHREGRCEVRPWGGWFIGWEATIY